MPCEPKSETCIGMGLSARSQAKCLKFQSLKFQTKLFSHFELEFRVCNLEFRMLFFTIDSMPL
jgi:hypothetical protein